MLNYDTGILADRIDVRDVIDEVPLAEVDGDLAVEAGLLEDTSGLSLVDTVYSVHRVAFGADAGS